MITIDTVAVFGAADHVGTGLLFVALDETCIHGTDARQEAFFVVVRPRLYPFGEQLDAALEQAERTATLLARAVRVGKQPVDGTALRTESVHQYRQEVAAFHLAPLTEPLQQVTDLRHDGRRVRVGPVLVGHHHRGHKLSAAVVRKWW